jgi:hypothetical protein
MLCPVFIIRPLGIFHERGRGMKIFLMTTALLCLIAVSAWSASGDARYVIPIKNNTPIYEHMSGVAEEKPVFTAGTSDWLMVLETNGDLLKVTDMKGNSGWINKPLVRQAATDKSMTFNGADIFAYLENPQPILILDGDNPDATRIMLDRSFAMELQDNIDRNTVNRIVGGSEAMW